MNRSRPASGSRLRHRIASASSPSALDRLKPNSLVLFNESFASTNEREGPQIATQIVHALLERRVKVFFVTHLYQLAWGFLSEGSLNATFLRAERNPDGTRPFKLVEAEPLQTSYGPDLYDAIFTDAGCGDTVRQTRT